MKRSIVNIQTETTEEEDDYSPKLKLCKFNHPSLSLAPSASTNDEESSCNTIVILDDCISSELLHVKYTTESFLISFLSNFETLLSTHLFNRLLTDQTLSRSLQRITNMYSTHRAKKMFRFLSNITEPAVILYWIKNITSIDRKIILQRAFPYLSSNVKQNEQVIIKLVENHCNLIIDELDFESLDDSFIIRMERACRTWVAIEKMCEKLTVDQTLMLINATPDFRSTYGSTITPYLPSRIVNDLKFWEKCKPCGRSIVFEENFEKLSMEIKNIKELILPWLKYPKFNDKNIDLYNNLSTELQKDVDIFVEMVKNGRIPKCLNEEMKTNRIVLLKAVLSQNCDYEALPKKFKQDQELLLLVLEHDPETFLKYNFHIDKNSLKLAIESNGKLFKYLSDSIRNDNKFFMKILKQPSWIVERFLENLSQELRNDKEFLLHLMKKDKLNYKYASKTLRNDPELYNQVISKDCYSKVYEFLPEHLKSDINLILKNVSTLHYITIIPPENIRNNKRKMMKLLELGNGIYNYASNELKCDREFVMKAFQYDIKIEIDLNYWKDDLQVLLNISNFDLETLSEPLRSNFNISVASISYHQRNLNLISHNLWYDINFIVNVLKRYRFIHSTIIEYIPKSILENKECVKQIARYATNCYVFQYVNSDFEFMLSLIDKINPLEYASDELRNNKQFIKMVITKYPESIRFISEELKDDCEFILNLVRECPKLDYGVLSSHCTPNVVGRVIQEYPHLFSHVSSDFKKNLEHQKCFYEMSLLNLEIFKEYLLYYPHRLAKHQRLLKHHLKLKVFEKFKNSHLAFNIWNQCSSLLKVKSKC